MNIRSVPPMTVDQFFDWYATQDNKFELVGGLAHMQPYVTRNHARITSNLIHQFRLVLGDDRYDVVATDFAIQTGPSTVRFPDLIVEPYGGPGDERITHEPLIVVEILSESTKHVDFGEKLNEYRMLGGLQHYLILAQEKPHVWLWSRGGDGAWSDDPVILEGMKADLALPLFGLTIPLSAIYAGVN